MSERHLALSRIFPVVGNVLLSSEMRFLRDSLWIALVCLASYSKMWSLFSILDHKIIY